MAGLQSWLKSLSGLLGFIIFHILRDKSFSSHIFSEKTKNLNLVKQGLNSLSLLHPFLQVMIEKKKKEKKNQPTCPITSLM